MPLVLDRCICLRKIEYSETSQIVTLLAREHGLFRAIAKGAHRRTRAGASKFDGGMDYLEVGDAVFTHDPARELATLTEWGLREGHLSLRLNLRAMHLGLYAAELVGRLVEEHDPHPPVFDRLEATLARLGTPRREQAFVAFELALLRETGYLPELGACVSCGASMRGLGPDAPAYFSARRGGAVCRACEGSIHDRRPIDPRLLWLAQGLVNVVNQPADAWKLPQLERRHSDPLNRMLAAHIEHALGQPLRMAKHVAP